MKALSRMLTDVFRAPRARPPRRSTSGKSEALRIAATIGAEIEPVSEGGMNVWPPRGIDEATDPHAGDHYAADWQAARDMLRTYQSAAK